MPNRVEGDQHGSCRKTQWLPYRRCLVLIKDNREILSHMREQRISGGGRPQVSIQARYDRLPMVDLVVRNVGAGAAKDITFAFSDP